MTRAGELLTLVLLAGAIASTSCDRITGTRPPAKPCRVDTMYYLEITSRIGRIDSLEVFQTIDRCGDRR